jgi:hypothetical protein
MVWKSVNLLIGLALTVPLGAADVPQELSKTDRRIGKQPQYIAEQPLYGLVVFGPEMKTRVWIVLDKSQASAVQYDVLYADVNGNSDLTDDGERISTNIAEDGTTKFKLPDIRDSSQKITHTEFSLRCAPADNFYQMVSVQWRGKQKFGGGYTDNPEVETYSRFASSPDKAPILLLNGDGPFTFQRWYTESLTLGQETDVKLFIGVPGVGTSTFCAFQIHALPEGEGIEGILHYTTTSGSAGRSPFKLLNKC